MRWQMLVSHLPLRIHRTLLLSHCRLQRFFALQSDTSPFCNDALQIVTIRNALQSGATPFCNDALQNSTESPVCNVPQLQIAVIGVEKIA